MPVSKPDVARGPPTESMPDASAHVSVSFEVDVCERGVQLYHRVHDSAVDTRPQVVTSLLGIVRCSDNPTGAQVSQLRVEQWAHQVTPGEGQRATVEA
jgi:hypothetical protein